MTKSILSQLSIIMTSSFDSVSPPRIRGGIRQVSGGTTAGRRRIRGGIRVFRGGIESGQVRGSAGGLSLVHVRKLHPGANLHPGCKFAPGVYFWPCERCFKNLHPGAKFAPGCKFAPAFEVVQIYLHPDANLHPGANCAHERKLYNFYTF